jgi:hypothetical protein
VDPVGALATGSTGYACPPGITEVGRRPIRQGRGIYHHLGLYLRFDPPPEPGPGRSSDPWGYRPCRRGDSTTDTSHPCAEQGFMWTSLFTSIRSTSTDTPFRAAPGTYECGPMRVVSRSKGRVTGLGAESGLGARSKAGRPVRAAALIQRNASVKTRGRPGRSVHIDVASSCRWCVSRRTSWATFGGPRSRTNGPNASRRVRAQDRA